MRQSMYRSILQDQYTVFTGHDYIVNISTGYDCILINLCIGHDRIININIMHKVMITSPIYAQCIIASLKCVLVVIAS